jgi:predicted ATPase
VAAEASYRDGIALAQRQDGRLFELRAATSLARLCRDDGRRDEAHALLAPLYGWFTEGFETADLKEAKALLDELAPPSRCCFHLSSTNLAGSAASRPGHFRSAFWFRRG